MVGQLGFATAIKTINRRARGLLLRPMRLGFANLWAFRGPFHSLPSVPTQFRATNEPLFSSKPNKWVQGDALQHNYFLANITMP